MKNVSRLLEGLTVIYRLKKYLITQSMENRLLIVLSIRRNYRTAQLLRVPSAYKEIYSFLENRACTIKNGLNALAWGKAPAEQEFIVDLECFNGNIEGDLSLR